MATRYAAIIDAGSTSSRIYVYRWTEGEGEDAGPQDNIRQVFPANGQQDSAVREPGMVIHLMNDILF